MKLRELLLEIDNESIIDEFVKFTVTELGISTLPKRVAMINSEKFPQTQKSFGLYSPHNDSIIVYAGNRHLADVLRTLAHELVHHKQREDNVQLDGSDGSPTENEANAKAGEVMRKFRLVYPEMYTET